MLVTYGNLFACDSNRMRDAQRGEPIAIDMLTQVCSGSLTLQAHQK